MDPSPRCFSPHQAAWAPLRSTVVYKRIASMFAEKHNKPYSRAIHWIGCRLNFSLLRSAIMCIRGSRSVHHRPAGPPITTNTFDLAFSEGGSQDQANTKHQQLLTYRIIGASLSEPHMVISAAALSLYICLSGTSVIP